MTHPVKRGGRRILHIIMNFGGWIRGLETLSLAVLTLFAFIQINHLKKVKRAKTLLYALFVHLVVGG